MLLKICLLALVACATAEQVSYKNYKVFRIIPSSDEQLEIVKRLEDQNHEDFSFWIGPSRVFQPIDMMVSPRQLERFGAVMDANDIKYAIYVKDVQQLIDNENPVSVYASGSFDWSKYHGLADIYAWLDSLAKSYPGKIEVLNAGRTYENRTIKGVKLSFGAAAKPGVLVEGGIHAREWISPATVTYLLNEFLTSQEPAVRKLAESYDWYIFPVFNPDGYVYTHTSNRMWRKTRSPSSNSRCPGADANRNWGYKWMHGGASNNPCSETYAGSKEFSEIETKTMSDFIKSIGDKLFAYLSFHSYSQVLLFPYGHTSEHLDNYKESTAIGLKTVDALRQKYGTKYVSGTIAEVMYIASGSSMDWAKGTLKLPVTFTYELRDKGSYGFLLPASQIVPNSKEVLDSFVALFDEAKKFGYPTKPSLHVDAQVE